jgi:hypothetical protein
MERYVRSAICATALKRNADRRRVKTSKQEWQYSIIIIYIWGHPTV